MIYRIQGIFRTKDTCVLSLSLCISLESHRCLDSGLTCIFFLTKKTENGREYVVQSAVRHAAFSMTRHFYPFLSTRHIEEDVYNGLVRRVDARHTCVHSHSAFSRPTRRCAHIRFVFDASDSYSSQHVSIKQYGARSDQQPTGCCQ